MVLRAVGCTPRSRRALSWTSLHVSRPQSGRSWVIEARVEMARALRPTTLSVGVPRASRCSCAR
eukprot:9693872-Lingulodinium_polyedra.AAC.1